MATQTKPKTKSGLDDKQVKKAQLMLKRAGLSPDLAGYRPDQIQRAIEARPTAKGDPLRRRIMSGEKRAPAKGGRKYSEEVRDAARIVREVTQGKGSPGAKQIAAVEKALDGKDPVEASGLGPRKLAEWAKGKWAPGRGKHPEKLTALAAKVNDPWASGRRLAAILHALAEVAAKRGTDG